MTRVLVRYKVHADKVALNETLAKAVYKQLHEENLEGFRYITFKMEDGVSFLHISFSANEQANKAFINLPAFKNFQANIKDRCKELPVVTPITVIDDYNFFAHLK
ncbi:MAG: hypothetical protein H7122_19505 [Chitinophagaceae bacterium]|nr:hypothetical protein [Chitinophagaceae bacterium]